MLSVSALSEKNEHVMLSVSILSELKESGFDKARLPTCPEARYKRGNLLEDFDVCSAIS